MKYCDCCAYRHTTATKIFVLKNQFVNETVNPGPFHRCEKCFNKVAQPEEYEKLTEEECKVYEVMQS